ncbi:hypothetical protein FE257_005386 [Aspergillus nanangensis]|uniref:DUF6987 domain-containing protein n=1 Tax=Aspergillus nanangensis TaxID=2582783 RepID=A0AAD4GVM7_ASPNN|nr:hypothetical protein FE257_005386 [Aspergillus nanangensis]
MASNLDAAPETVSPHSSTKDTPLQLRSKEPAPVLDDDDEELPSTPTKLNPDNNEQRDLAPSPAPEESQSQASGSAAPPRSGFFSRALNIPGQLTSALSSVAGRGSTKPVDDVLPLDLSALKGLHVGESGSVLGQDGSPLGQLVEGNPQDLVGQVVGDNGEILDEDGDLIGRVEIVVPEVVDQAAPQAGNTVSKVAGMPVSESGAVRDPEGQVVGKVVEGNPQELVGKVPNEQGEILNEEGEMVGRAATATVTAASVASTGRISVSKLAGLAVSESGDIKDPAGKVLGKVVEGDPQELAGQVPNEQGQIVNEEGEIIGRVAVASLPALSQAGKSVVKLADLAGMPLSESGDIKGPTGSVLGRLVEGDAQELAGQAPNEQGEILNEEGEIIGRVAAASRKASSQAGKSVERLAALAGLPLSESGDIKDPEGQVIGRLVEGDAQDLAGQVPNDQGEILNEDGEVIGRVVAATITSHAGTDPEGTVADEAELPPLSILEGLKCNKMGKIISTTTGQPIGEVIEGDPKKLSRMGAQLDDKGQFWDSRGKVIGKAQTLPVAEQDDEPIFAGLEGLHVVEDGWVEDGQGKRVGKIVEGDAKKILGRPVDEDGEVTDQHGNVIAKAEYWETPDEPEAEVVDLSQLNGLTPNKLGFVIGPHGVPIARVVEGNLKELVGKEIEDGQIWNGRTPIGRVELIPENEREKKPEGPFAGLENLVVNKDGFVEDADGNVVGQVTEGDAKLLRGRSVDEDGDIIDKFGSVKGHAERYEPPEEEKEVEDDLSILDGKMVNKAGNVVDAQGTVFGRIISGDGKRMAGRKVDGQGQVWGDNGKVIGKAELIPGAEQQKAEGPFYGFDNAEVGKDGVVIDGARIIGRVIEGDAKRLFGRKVDEDGDILDKNGNTLGRAERWEPEEKKRNVNPMAGRKVTREGEVRDVDGNLIGKLTSGNLATLIGKEIDDNGSVVDNDGNKLGECTLLENIPEPEPEGPSQQELDEQRKLDEEQKKIDDDRQLAKRMSAIVGQTLDRVQPICKMITDLVEKAERTPKEELDEEKLVKDVKPLLEEGNSVLQECNGAIRALDPDGRIAATAKARAASHEASPEEYALADKLKEMTDTVVRTIDNARRKIADMPHAKKELNPLWGLLSEPLFQIIAAVGLLLTGVLGLVGRLLDGLGLGPIVNRLLGGLGLDKLLGGLGLGSVTDALGLTKKK